MEEAYRTAFLRVLRGHLRHPDKMLAFDNSSHNLAAAGLKDLISLSLPKRICQMYM